jgi:hypothetical protein
VELFEKRAVSLFGELKKVWELLRDEKKPEGEM